MATIYTRASKGSALTWTEGDANITNLNTAKIENLVEDLTPQLGGDLDVNGKKIVSASNGNIALEPNGTGIITANKNIESTADVKAKEFWSTNSTGDEGGQINLAQPATNSTLGGDTVTIDVWQNRLRIFEQGGDARGVYIDLTAAANGVGTNLLGGGGISLTSLSVGTEGTASGDGSIAYNNSTGVFTYTPPTAAGIGALVSGGALGTPSSGTVTNLTGTASININGTVGATTASTGAFTTLSASSTVSGTGFSTYLASPPAIGGTTAAAGRFTTLTTTNTTATIVSESNGNIVLAPNGTGQTAIKNLEYNEFIFAICTTSGTIAPDVANGNVQSITLNGNLTLNAFTNPVAGQSLTLIDTTGGTGRTLTSTMLFSGGSKTLSTTSTVDIITVFYNGTTYYASLAKDFK